MNCTHAIDNATFLKAFHHTPAPMRQVREMLRGNTELLHQVVSIINEPSADMVKECPECMARLHAAACRHLSTQD